MRPQHFLKSISAGMIGVTLTITLLLFVCPIGVFGAAPMTSPSAGISAGCHDGALSNGPAHSIATFTGCLNFHLAAVNQFTESLFTLAKLSFAALLFVFIAVYFYTVSSTSGALERGLSRFKHRYRRYLISIRLLCQKKLMAWLSFLEHSQDASLIA